MTVDSSVLSEDIHCVADLASSRPRERKCRQIFLLWPPPLRILISILMGRHPSRMFVMLRVVEMSVRSSDHTLTFALLVSKMC